MRLNQVLSGSALAGVWRKYRGLATGRAEKETLRCRRSAWVAPPLWRCLLLATAVIAAQGRSHSQDIDPDSLAILQRLVEVREADRGITVELVRAKAGQLKRAYRLHSFGDKLRIDKFSGESIVEDEKLSTLLILGDDAWGYRYEEGAELIKTTAENAESDGFMVMDPRQLGLLLVHKPNKDLPKLIFGGADKIWTLRDEVVEGVEAKLVDVERPEEIWSSLVDPESGRVLKRTQFFNRAEHGRLRSKYESDSVVDWLPSAVHISGPRMTSDNLIEIRFVSHDPDPSLFELASLEIPPGTAVKDMTAARELGSSDGVEVDSEAPPVENIAGVPSGTDQGVSGGTWSYVGLAVGGCLLLIMAAVVYYAGGIRRLARPRPEHNV